MFYVDTFNYPVTYFVENGRKSDDNYRTLISKIRDTQRAIRGKTNTNVQSEEVGELR